MQVEGCCWQVSKNVGKVQNDTGQNIKWMRKLAEVDKFCKLTQTAELTEDDISHAGSLIQFSFI